MTNGNGLVNLDGGHTVNVSSHSFRAVQFSIEALAVSSLPFIISQVSKSRVRW